jgi:hypothetical protein
MSSRVRNIGLVILVCSAVGAYFYFHRGPEEVTPELQTSVLAVGSKNFEVFSSMPTLGRPWPVVIFMNGEAKENAKFFVTNKWLETLSDEGFVALAIPFNPSAIQGVLKTLLAQPEVRPDAVFIIGTKRGITTADDLRMLARLERPGLKAKWFRIVGGELPPEIMIYLHSHH